MKQVDNKSKLILLRTSCIWAMILLHSLVTWNAKSVSLEIGLTVRSDDGVNIDNWTFDALVEQVTAFRLEQDALVN